MTMTDLTEFVLARIAEDEAVARAATPGAWEAQPADGYNPAALGSRPDSADVAVAGSGDEYGPQWVCLDRDGIGSTTMPNAEHIARHDPARVLAECEAKRRIVEAFRHSEDFHYLFAELASPYADHPDYRDEWRP